MKRLYVCGSFRFMREMEALEDKLKKEGIRYQISRKMNSRGILGCLKKIDGADIVYIVNPEGYVGKSVSVDIGYAYAKKKPVYVMQPINDPPVINLVNGVLSSDELVDFLKDSSLAQKGIRRVQS